MAYTFTNSRGQTYYLHAKKVVSKVGKERQLYYFGRAVKDGAQDALPAGYSIVEMKTGLPVLKKV